MPSPPVGHPPRLKPVAVINSAAFLSGVALRREPAEPDPLNAVGALLVAG